MKTVVKNRMKTAEEKLKQRALRTEVYCQWKKKILEMNPGDELEVSGNPDRSMEGNLVNWAYRLKKENIFFRRETRLDKVFIIREK